MPWFKVDDQLHMHPKWRMLSKPARALWTTAGSWAASQTTDGHVPKHMLSALDGKPKEADELVAAGLWTADENGGWRYHDWLEFQPSRADVLAVKVKESRSGALGNHNRWHRDKGVTNPECVYCKEST